MEVSQFAANVMKHVRDYVQPALETMTRQFAEALADLRKDFDQRIAAIPAGEKGERGDSGEKGERGDPGQQGERGEKGESGERGEKGDQGERGESGTRGEKGEKGDAGEAGLAGADGKDGRDGIDGKSITPEEAADALWNRFEAQFERRMAEIERAATERHDRLMAALPKPKDGRDGADGKDGLGFDDMSVEQADERNMVFYFSRGDQVKEFPLRLSTFIDRDVYAEGTEYFRGDGVSWGGSYFIARKDHPVGKPGQSPDWRLAVKRGRDGKDGEVKGAPPATVRLKP